VHADAGRALHDARDGALADDDAGSDDDAGLDRADASGRPRRTADEECRAYDGAPIEFTRYADDFAADGFPDVAFTWTPLVTGVYRLTLPPLFWAIVLHGECGGPIVPSLDDTLAVRAGEPYTVVVSNESDAAVLALDIEFVCSDPDANCAVPPDLSRCGTFDPEDPNAACTAQR
jgi:hypothetical protein